MAFRLIFAAISALALSAGVVFAHSKKETSHPADGAALTEAPEIIGMSFDTPIMITMFRITGTDGAEMPFEGGELAPATDYQVVPAELSSGNYSVEWRGLSEDGHPVEGTFSFSIE